MVIRRRPSAKSFAQKKELVPDRPCKQWEVLKLTRMHAIQASSRVRTHMLSTVVEVNRRRKSVPSLGNTIKDVSILLVEKVPRRWAGSMPAKDGGPLLMERSVNLIYVRRKALLPRQLDDRRRKGASRFKKSEISSMRFHRVGDVALEGLPARRGIA